MHVYRWDLDRTYLATDIHSVRGLVRAALEHASQKRNVPGSAALLRGLVQHDPTCRVAIVSGSPTQMRKVLEEKLALDGVRFDGMVLKDSLGNLRRGRLRAIKGQLGYKLPVLLAQRVGLGPAVRETLFGDDCEVDALIYTVYAEALSGRLSEGDVARIMEAGGAYADSVQESISTLRKLGRGDIVQDVFILVDRGVPLATFRKLGRRVVPVFSWVQAAAVLWLRGRLGADGVAAVAREVEHDASLDERGMAALFQDLVRRARLTAAEVERLLDEAPALGPLGPAVRTAVARLGPGAEPPSPGELDLLGFLRDLG